MKIRFKIDRRDLFLRGINSESAVVTLVIEPAVLRKDQLELLSSHLLFVDDMESVDVVVDPQRLNETVPVGGRPGADLIEARDPTVDSLLSALIALGSNTRSWALRKTNTETATMQNLSALVSLRQ